MATRHDTSTLSWTERELRPLVTRACVLATLVELTLLALSLATGAARPTWAACALLSLALTATNLRYQLMHGHPTIGMMPVALFALLPATVAAIRAPDMPAALRAGCFALLLVLALVTLGFGLCFARLRMSYHARPPVAPDAVLIVLGGAVRQGRPCATLARRLDVATRLWHESPRRTIVVSGGATPDHTTTEADVMADYLRRQGVDEASIVRERRARNTRENVARSLSVIWDLGISGQACVVSSDYHLFRALRDARDMGVELTGIPAPTPLPSALQQWSREALTILARH